MKKHQCTLCVTLLAVVTLWGCSVADDTDKSTSMEWQVTAHATKEGGDIQTRALFIGGNSGSRYYSLWDKGDEAVVYKAGINVGIMKPTKEGDPTSDLKGVLTGAFSQGDELTIYTPNTAFDYTGQKGTIGDVSSNHAYMETTTHVASVSGTDVYTDKVTFHSSQSYLIFHFLDSEGKRLHVKQLTISAASGKLVQQKPLNSPIVYGDIVIETEEVDGEYPRELFVVLHNDYGEADTYSFSVVTPEGTYESDGDAQKVVNATLVDGECYKVVRTLTLTSPFPGAQTGKFTVDISGHKVYFSQGNLQASYNGSSWTWAFAANPWDFIGDNNKTSSGNGNTSVLDSPPYVSGTNVTVDLFGWVGASSTWTDEARLHGITSSSVTNGYGNVNGNNGEVLKSDWGTLPISNGGGAAGSGWRTPTSAEWTYVFNTRATTSNNRYAMATVNNVSGIILLPDDWSTSYYNLNYSNNADFTSNIITSDQWTYNFASHGAVFLPAAGYRDGASVNNSGGYGVYWSSSPYTSNESRAYYMSFSSGYLAPENPRYRYYGCSVRLVRDVK